MILHCLRLVYFCMIFSGLVSTAAGWATEIPKNAWLGDTFSNIGWRSGFVSRQSPEVNRTQDQKVTWRSGAHLGVFDSDVTGNDSVNHQATTGVAHFSYFSEPWFDSALSLPIPDGIKVFRAGVDVRPFNAPPAVDQARKPQRREQFIGLILMPTSNGNWFTKGEAPLRVGIDRRDGSAYRFIIWQRGQPAVTTPVEQLRDFHPDQFNHIEIIVNLNHGTVVAFFNGVRAETGYKLKSSSTLKYVGIEAMPGTKFTSGYADNFYIAPPGDK